MSICWLVLMALALSSAAAGCLLPSLSPVLVLTQLLELVFGLLFHRKRTLVLLPIAGKRAEHAHVSSLVGRNVAWTVVCRLLERVSSEAARNGEIGICHGELQTAIAEAYSKVRLIELQLSQNTSTWASA